MNCGVTAEVLAVIAVDWPVMLTLPAVFAHAPVLFKKSAASAGWVWRGC